MMKGNLSKYKSRHEEEVKGKKRKIIIVSAVTINQMTGKDKVIMKRTWKKNLSVILAAALVLSGTDCGSLSSVYAHEYSARESNPVSLTEETLPSEDENTSATEQSTAGTEDSSVEEQDTDASTENGTPEESVPEESITEKSVSEESVSEESQEMNASTSENGIGKIAIEDTEEAETEEEIAVNADSGTCGDSLTWAYNSDTRTLTISGAGEMTDFQSDSQGSGTAPWRGSGSDFSGHRDTTVIIEEGVTSIGTYAFQNCNLTTVSIPKSLKSIGNNAFDGCAYLAAVTVPVDANLESIGSWAFQSSGLKNITIDCPVRVGNDAFAACAVETASIIYASETSVETSTFARCDKLTTITLGGDFASIENLAFQNCYVLTTVTIPDASPSIAGSSNSDQSPFVGCKLTKIDATNGLGDIGDYAFYGRNTLESIKFSDKAVTIGQGAFGNCKALSSIEIPKSITSINESAFSSCSGLNSITFSPRDNQSQLTIGTCAFGWCGMEQLEIPDNTTVGESAFTTDTVTVTLKKLTIGDHVALGKNAFDRQSNLKEIIFEKDVTIDNTAFENCGSQYLMKLYKNTSAHTYAKDNGKTYKYRVEQVTFTPDPDNKDPREMAAGEGTLEIKLLPDSSGTNNDGIATIAEKTEWQSSNPDVVSIGSDAPTTAENSASVTVNALKAGTSTITVTCDGKTATCDIKVMVPAEPVTASPESGAVIYCNSAKDNTVTLSCTTDGAKIYYTTDGTIPTKESQLYSTPITFDGSKSSVTVKAFAAASGYLNSEISTFTYTIKKKAEGIEINSPSLTLGIGESRILTASFTPEGAEPETTPVTWKSDNENIVSVTPDSATKATIKALGAGTCTITAECGSFAPVTCEVTVNDRESVSPVTAEPDSGEVPAGTTVTLDCATEGASIYYTTDDSEPSDQSTLYKDPVTVRSEMTIKAVAIKSGFNNSETATFTYTVKQEIPGITGIALDKNELKLGAGQKDKLTVSFQPENALPEKITWTSSNRSVAQVLADTTDSTTAEVSGQGAGTCTITASCGDFKAECKVTVMEKECVPAVKAEPGAGAVEAGTKVSLLCDITDAEIYYTTDKTLPTAQSRLYSTPITIENDVTIRAVAVKEGYEDSAVSTFAYTIKKEEEIPVTGILLDKTELHLPIGNKENLTVRFQPADATPKEVVWTSDNTEIADVTPGANGTTAEVTGKKDGTCTITATCDTYKAVCNITVTKPVSPVQAEPGAGAVKKGTKVTLTCDTEGAKIYYTADAADDTVPVDDAHLYQEPVTIEKAVTIRAAAVKEGYGNSPVSTFAYTIANDEENPVTITGITLGTTSMELGIGETGSLTASFQPADAAPQTVTWKSDNPEIADVSADPDNSASAKVLGKKDGQCTITASCLTFTASCTVTVTGEKRVSNVYATPSAESAVTPGTEVQLLCDTKGADIYYTLDGSIPTTADTRYTNAILLTGDTTIQAFAVKEGYTDSAVSVFEFTVNDIVPDIPDINPPTEGIWIASVADQPYTGSAIKPAVYVYDGKKLLTEKTDYTVSYKNNTKPGTAQITVTGKGNYTDKKTAAFHITSKNISDTDVIIEEMAYAYNGKTHKTAPAITHNGKKLKLNRDFEVTYGEGGYIEEGKYTLAIKGIGNYTGTAYSTISIIGKDKLVNKAAVASIPAQQYNKGNAVTLPDILIKVKLGGQFLQIDKDYTVSYVNNINPGKATIIIKGIGDYAGTKKATFKIVRTAVNMSEVTCINSNSFLETEFVKGGCTPHPVLTHDGYTLRAGTDYTVSYKNNKKTGTTAKLVASGKGNFKGKKEISFTVSQKDITKVFMYTPNVPYTGRANKYQTKPILTDSDGTRLKANTDYTLTFTDGSATLDKRSNPPENAVITVHVKGKGNYCGERTDTYTLSGTSFNAAKITINNKDYTGKAVTITKEDIKSATIKVAGTTSQLTYGVDFEAVSYSKNVKKGTATVVLCGKGKYSGEKTFKFKIVSKSIQK